jgi:hypothetical protein
VQIPFRETAADKIKLRTGEPQKKAVRGQSAKSKDKSGKSVQWGNQDEQPPNAPHDQNQDETNIELAESNDVEKKMREH